jgi:hypothetical protein
MSKHGAAFVRDVKDVAMAFLALFIREGCVGLSPLHLVIIFTHVLSEMNDDIFYSVYRLRVEEIECVMGSWEVTVHTVCDKTLGIIDVGGCFPGVEGKLNFMAGSAKLRSGRTNHCVIGNAKQRKSDHDANNQKDAPYEIFFHGRTLYVWMLFVFIFRILTEIMTVGSNIP